MTWPPSARRTRLLAMAVASLFAVYFGLYGAAILMRPGPFRFGDFFALWSYGQVLAAHPAAELYDFATLVARQVALGMATTESNPFPYPPSFMLFVWPLGLLPYTAAYVAFMAATFGAYVLAVGLAAPPPRMPLVLTALVAPTSILTLVSGQSGFLAAALFLGGMACAPARPVLGGILLGLLAYKPQLGLLVPVALLAAGLWRTTVAACATVAATVLASSAAFGWRIWAEWLAYLPNYATQFERESGGDDFLMPTPTASLHAHGVAPEVVRLVQLAVLLCAVAWVWHSFRRGAGARATLVLATATFLATPHAFIYDLPMLTGAVLLFIAARAGAGVGLTTIEVATLSLALIFPAIMVFVGRDIALGVVSLALLAASLIARPAGAERAPA